MGTTDAMDFLLDKLKYSKTNQDFFDAHEHLAAREQPPHPAPFLTGEGRGEGKALLVDLIACNACIVYNGSMFWYLIKP